MAAATSEATYSYTKEYEVGAGTVDQGRDYEFKMVALISLRCLLQDFDDVCIALNAAGLGALDDVLVNARRKDGDNIKILLQLKHEEKGKDIVREQLLAPKGNYSLLKYYNDIVKLKKKLDCKSDQKGIIKDLGTSNNMYFTLFTNKGIKECEFLEDSGCDAISFLNTGINNDNLYRFNLTKASTLSSLPNLDSSINFCLFSKQSHASHLNELIAVEMQNMIEHFGLTDADIQTVSKMFIEYVTAWAKGELGKHYYLTKQDILYKLTDLLLCQYELDLRKEKLDFYDGEPKLLWNTVVKDKLVTVVDSDDGVIAFVKLYVGSEIRSYSHSGILWGDKFSSEEQSSFYKEHTYLKKAMLKIVGNNGKITLLSIYKCLWFNERLPLLLNINTIEDYDVILKILKLSNCKLKVIILNANTLKPTITNSTPGYFTNLSDLNNEHRLKILNNSVKLQGRNVVLKELIDDSLFRHINCNVVIHILLGNCNIGNEYEPLSEYFIKRSLLKIFMKIDVLEQIKDETFVIEINKETKDKSIRDQLDTLISRHKNKTNIFFDTNKIEELKYRKKIIHRLMFHDENLLEWKESFGSTKQIRKYQFSHRNDFNMYASEMGCSPKNANWLYNDLEDILANNNSTNFFNDVNLVSASPGMGKSTLLDYVASKASTKMWVLNVKLIDHDDYYDNTKSRREMSTAQDHLKHFNNSILKRRECINMELARGVFQNFVNAKQVLVMLDGFDEVLLSCKDEVMEIAQRLHEAGYPIWLTTRPHLKTDLEERFATISTTVRPFTVDDQNSFLNKYFKHIGDKVNDNKENHQTLIEEFVKKLLQASRDNLNDTNGEFMGIPLQTKLLANAFSEELKHSLSTGIIQFKRRFDLLHLYEELIKRKDNILGDKFGKGVKDMRILFFQKHQQLFALQLIFSDYNLYRLDIDEQLKDYYNNNEDQIKFLQQDGVTVIQRNLTGTGQKFQVSFVHRTFAEYMAALWLLNNFNSERDEYRWTARFLLRKRDTYSWYGLFRMFDSMLARDSRLHLLIINGRLGEAQKLVKSEPEIGDKIDAGGRSLLHMLAFYGNVYHRRNILEVQDRMTDFMQQIPEYSKYSKIINMRDKLGYSPLDYVTLNSSFDRWKLPENSNEITITSDILDLLNIYTRCGINFKCETLIKTHLPLFICQELLVNSHSVIRDTTILSYCYKSFENNENIVAIIKHYTNELNIKTISELLISTGIKSSTEPPYYYDLRFAAAFGTSRNVRDLISSESGTNNQEHFNNFYTPLYWAVKHNRLEIVKILLSYGENVNEFSRCTKAVTPLHCAAANGYTDIAKELLLHQADVNVQNDLGATPLILALKNKHADTAKLLLSSHANVRTKDIFNCFPLYYAAENGLSDIIPDLIGGVDINHPNFDDSTPLTIAISNGHLSTVRVLLQNGANCTIQNSLKKLPLHIAAQTRFCNILEEILSKTVINDDNTSKTNTNIQDVDGYTALHYVCGDCSSDKDDGKRSVILLLNKGADINLKNYNGETPLHVFLNNWYLEFNSTGFEIISLLSKEENLNIQDIHGDTALHYLCRRRSLHKDDGKRVVISLLNKGVDINLKNNKGQTPLHDFLDNGSSEYDSTHFFRTVSLLSSEDSVNIQDIVGNTVLHCLCCKFPHDKDDCKSVVRSLLNKGANINLKNNNGHTPLHVFLANVSSEFNLTRLAIVSLLSSEYNLNIQDNYGDTALHYLCRNRSLDKDVGKSVVKSLLNKGADTNLKNNYGLTPLFDFLISRSSKYNSTDCPEITFLLSSEDNVNIQSSNGDTVLHYLCWNWPADIGDRKSIVISLLNKGADVNLKNNKGETPLDVFLIWRPSEYNSTDWPEIISLLSSKDNVNIQNTDGDTVLHYLCRYCPLDEDGGKSTVISLLNKGADTNLKNNYGLTPLLVFISNRSLQYNSTCLKMISSLSSEDNVNIRNIDGDTALHYLGGNCPLNEEDGKSLVISLLNKGADINLKNNNGQTPLLAFLSNRSSKYDSTDCPEIISLLSIENNVNIQDMQGDTVLHYLWRECPLDEDNRKSTVVSLLNKGADINLKNNNGQTSLHVFLSNRSSKYNSTDCREIISLLSSEDNVNIQNIHGDTALHYLCWNWPVDKDDGKRIVISLLIKGSDINLKNNNNETSLHVFLSSRSSKYNSTDCPYIISLLSCEDNVNIQNIRGDTALHNLWSSALLDKDDGKSIVISLLNKGADINLKNNDGQTPLLGFLRSRYSKYNSTDCHEVISLLSSEDNVNMQDIRGDSALHHLWWSARLDKDDRKSIVTPLLNKGADINLKNNNGLTPLFVFLRSLSSKYNSTDCLEIISLLSTEDTVNIQNICEDTVLHYVCWNWPVDKDCKRVVISLLNKGAEINIINNNGLTPLFVFLRSLSSKYNSTDCPEIISLLSSEDNINIQNIDGDTALHYLGGNCPLNEEDGKSLVISLLNKGADINLKNNNGQTPLLAFLSNRSSKYNSTDCPEIISLLSSEDNINIQNIDGDTALHYLGGNCPLNEEDGKSLVISLLNKGADINLKNNNGQTPLLAFLSNRSSKYNSTDCPEIISLLSSEDNINIQNIDGDTALHYLGGNCPLNEEDGKSLVISLLNKGADINLKNNNGQTPLLAFLSNRSSKYNSTDCPEIISLLSSEDNINIQNIDGDTALHYLGGNCPLNEEDGKSLVISLLNKGADINLKNNNGQTPLLAFLSNRSSKYNSTDCPEIISLLSSEDNINIQNIDGDTALHYLGGNCPLNEEDGKSLVISLLNKGADINLKNNNGQTPLLAFLSNRSSKYNSTDCPEIISLLSSEDNINIQNIDGDTALHYLGGNCPLNEEDGKSLVISLLNKGADINLKNNNGQTPLLAFLSNRSSKYNSTDCPEIISLLSSEDNINIQNIDGDTALHYLGGNCPLNEEDGKSLVISLLNKGADINLKNNNGQTPLLAFLSNRSSKYNSTDCPEIISLLSSEDNINIQNIDGDTALHYLGGNCPLNEEDGKSLVISLLNKGADINLKNNNGQTPLLAFLSNRSSKYNSTDCPEIISLLSSEDNINIQNIDGDTALHYLGGNCPLNEEDGKSLVISLLNKGADINLKNNNGQTPLLAFLSNRSSKYNSTDCPEIISLLSSEDNINIQNIDGDTALHYLGGNCPLNEEDGKSLVISLLNKGADINLKNNNGQTPLLAFLSNRSSKYNSTDCPEIISLLSSEDNINIQNIDGDTALHYLGGNCPLNEEDGKSLVISLLNKGADINLKNNNGQTPLLAFLSNRSSKYNSTDCPEIISLLSSEDNINIQNIDGDTALHYLGGNCPLNEEDGKSLVISLLNKGADINLKNNNGQTPLLAFLSNRSSKYNSTDCPEIISLLSSEDNINIQNIDGDTALHYLGGNCPLNEEDGKSLVISLLNKGADINLKNNNGQTPLLAFLSNRSSKYNSTDCPEIISLLSSEDNINIQNIDGDTALHYLGGNCPLNEEDGKSLVISLLNKGADINLKNNNGQTPLLAFLSNRSSKYNSTDCPEIISLLSSEDNINIQNIDGDTALHYLGGNCPLNEEDGKSLVISLLNKGADINLKNNNGQTPLLAFLSNRSSKYNSTDCPEIISLLSSEDNINIQNIDGDTALHYLGGNCPLNEEDGKSLVISLLNKGADINLKNNNGQTPLLAFLSNRSSKYNSTDCPEIISLLSSEDNINIQNIDGDTALHYLGGNCPLNEEDGKSLVISLLNKGADINLKNNNGQTPLLAFLSNRSSKYNSTDCPEIISLLSSEDNINIQNIDGDTALHYLGGNCPLNEEDGKSLVISLLNKGADINLKNNNGQTPLLAFLSNRSSKYNSTDCPEIISLLSSEDNINIQNIDGDTALHYLGGNCPLNEEDGKSLVISLLNKGADINLKNNNGQTPLLAFLSNRSSKYNSTDCPEIISLLSSEDNINIQNIDGDTALHYLGGNCPLNEEDGKSLVISLLNKGADINLKNNNGQTPLLAFLSNRSSKYNSTDCPEIISLLSSEDNINIQNIDGDTALHYLGGNCPLNEEDGKSLVISLLNKGADINLKNNNGQTPLLAFLSNRSSKYNSTDCPEIISLLSSEDNINIQNIDGDTALHYLGGNCPLNEEDGKSLVISLLNKGADINLKNNNGQTPLLAFLSNRSSKYNSTDCPEIISLLSSEDNINIQNIDGDTALHYLGGNCPLNEEDGKSLVISLLNKGADINLKNNNGQTPLLAFLSNRSSKYNSTDCPHIIPLLSCEDNVNIQNIRGDSALHNLWWSALLNRDNGKSIVMSLLNKGADINLKNNNGLTPLFVFLGSRSSKYNSTDCLEIISLLSTEDNVKIQNIDGDTALHYLCWNCPVDNDCKSVVISLLNKGAEINIINNNGVTPLHAFLSSRSSEYNSTDCLEVISLLSTEDNVNIRDIHGDTILHYLYRNFPLDKDDGKSIVILLLNKGADINLKNNDGQTPLFVFLRSRSSKYNSTDCLEVISLLSTEDNANIRDIHGDTILHYLYRNCPLDKDDGKSIVISLVNKGADINLKNNDGQTPLFVFLRSRSSKYNSTDCLEVISLLSTEDNVNIRDIHGDTILHDLYRNCPLDKEDGKSIVKSLLNKGADLNLKNNDGQTPLFVFLRSRSSKYNSTDCPEIISLLSSEDNVNIQNIDGDTALHYLYRNCPLNEDDGKSMVIALLNRGAEINIMNNNGETPLRVFLSLPSFHSTHRSEIISLLSR